VTFVHEYIQVAFGRESGRQCPFYLLDVTWNVSDLFAFFLAAELVD
jgi:hypothetical protein